MADESYGFTQARVRLEEIVSAVRKKDTSLEKSLDLLEEGVRLANQCTELIDHADWEAAGTGQPIVPGVEADGVVIEGGEGATEAAAAGTVSVETGVEVDASAPQDPDVTASESDHDGSAGEEGTEAEGAESMEDSA